MKVKVTRRDIANGRLSAGKSCGCPIWHALCRRLRIVEAENSNTPLVVPSVYQATLGRIVIPLPQAAVDFQDALMEDADAKVRPFEFETELEVEGK